MQRNHLIPRVGSVVKPSQWNLGFQDETHGLKGITEVKSVSLVSCRVKLKLNTYKRGPFLPCFDGSSFSTLPLHLQFRSRLSIFFFIHSLLQSFFFFPTYNHFLRFVIL
ncbi:DNA repair protein rhp54 [Fusarium oxysporum f. sp. albedinis]|nr:DNA repair protein rhp54 [Fusarium oxysporum f. sp. albedinis]